MHPVVDLGEPFARLDEHDAADLLRSTFGVEAAHLERLDTERDDTFRVRTAAGSYVLQVAHPDDDPLYVNMQTAAMSFAAEAIGTPITYLFESPAHVIMSPALTVFVSEVFVSQLIDIVPAASVAAPALSEVVLVSVPLTC